MHYDEYALNRVLLLLNGKEITSDNVALLCQTLNQRSLEVLIIATSESAQLLPDLSNSGWSVLSDYTQWDELQLAEASKFSRCKSIIVFTTEQNRVYWQKQAAQTLSGLIVLTAEADYPAELAALVAVAGNTLPAVPSSQKLIHQLNSDDTKSWLISAEQPALSLVTEPVWFELAVHPGDKLVVKSKVNYIETGNERVKKALVLFRADTASGQLTRLDGLNFSELSQASFCYLPDTKGDLATILQLTVPPAVEVLQIGVQGFFLHDKQQVLVSELMVEVNERTLLITEVIKRIKDVFYNKGAVTAALARLESLSEHNILAEAEVRSFHRHVGGVARLKRLPVLPALQTAPLYLPRSGQILYCAHQALPHVTNGYATRTHGVVKGLQQAGFSLRVVARPGMLPLTELGHEEGFRTQCIDDIEYVFHAGSQLDDVALDHYLQEAADVFVREALTCQAQLIIAASNHVVALPALIAARRLGIPFIYEVRGLWELTKASLRPLWRYTERFSIDKALEQFVAGHADLVLTLTEQLSLELQQRQVPAERIRLIPNAVDTDFFSPRAAPSHLREQLNLPPQVPVIGYAGSAVAYEGLSLLMHALAMLKQRQLEFIFLLVGDGAVLEQVKVEAEQLGLTKHCRFTGRVAFEQMPDYIACMDIMPIPRLGTLVTEMVSALKPLEAMAMAKAVVLSDVAPHNVFAADNADISQQSIRALLFEKDNAQALADVLQRLLQQEPLRSQLGQNARAWVCGQRSWKKVTADYAAELDKLLRESPVRGCAGVPLSQCKLALIADTFTVQSLDHVAQCILLSKDGWLQQLNSVAVDALLIESAWNGNNGSWYRSIGYYSEAEFAQTKALITYCNLHSIPVLFWNKEDPVHTDRFSMVAGLADHVFTSDAACIMQYLQQSKVPSGTVSSAGFFAAPHIHNPLPSKRGWQHTLAYAGTYYGQRYAERSNTLDMMFSTAAPLGLTIYDRQAELTDSPYRFPAGLAAFNAGSLAYEQTVEAYKSHPIHLNVNSVTQSVTMCSRRVMEIAACGTAIISGPSLAISRVFADSVVVVENDQQMLMASELLEDDARRWQLALAAQRKVLQAHTANQRLALMLRTAGLVCNPMLPKKPVLVVFDMTLEAAEHLLAQTLLPEAVLAVHWQESARELISSKLNTTLVDQHNTDWLWVLSSAQLCAMAENDIEDLVLSRLYYDKGSVAFNRDTNYKGGSRGLAGFDLAADLSVMLLTAAVPSDEASELYQLLRNVRLNTACLQIRKPARVAAKPPSQSPIMLVAAHDVKFMRMLWPYLRSAGYRLLLDFWHDHKTHNEQRSLAILTEAQLIFCEWLLGNMRWYSQHKQPQQLLLGRLHAQEIKAGYLHDIRADKVDALITVSQHMLEKLESACPDLAEKCQVIANAVDTSRFTAEHRCSDGYTLGLVGMVPKLKRFDRALDILAELRQIDPRYRLRIKGKQPADFFWMQHRPQELSWYNKQYIRLQEDPLLQDAVLFDEHADDMPDWYRTVDCVLSVSDEESFHYAIAEAALAGCKPVIWRWYGSETLFPATWIADTLPDVIALITSPDNDDQVRQRQEFITKHFSAEHIANQWCAWLEELVNKNQILNENT